MEGKAHGLSVVELHMSDGQLGVNAQAHPQKANEMSCFAGGQHIKDLVQHTNQHENNSDRCGPFWEVSISSSLHEWVIELVNLR